MWHKLYDDVFSGAMFGAPPQAWLVWFYVIGRADRSMVELQPALLAATFAMDVDDVKLGIKWLCEPKPDSKIRDHDGRMIVPRGGITYFVPGWERYQGTRTQEDRRAAWKEDKREQRALNKPSKFPAVENGNGAVCAEEVTHPAAQEALEKFWQAYPRAENRVETERAFVEVNGAKHIDEILAALAWQIELKDWKKEGGRWVPSSAKYLTQKRWTDKKKERKLKPRYPGRNTEWDQTFQVQCINREGKAYAHEYAKDSDGPILAHTGKENYDSWRRAFESWKTTVRDPNEPIPDSFYEDEEEEEE